MIHSFWPGFDLWTVTGSYFHGATWSQIINQSLESDLGTQKTPKTTHHMCFQLSYWLYCENLVITVVLICCHIAILAYIKYGDGNSKFQLVFRPRANPKYVLESGQPCATFATRAGFLATIGAKIALFSPTLVTTDHSNFDPQTWLFQNATVLIS